MLFKSLLNVLRTGVVGYVFFQKLDHISEPTFDCARRFADKMFFQGHFVFLDKLSRL